MAWFPNAERVTTPNRGEGTLNPVAVICHRTYGFPAGDLSVLKGSRAPVGFHFLVLPDGRIYQGASTTARCNHAKGANDWSIGIEVSSRSNSIPMTPAQLSSVGRLCGWISRTHGIPLRYFPAKEREGRRAGFVPHWGVAGSDHGDGWSNDEWNQLVKFAGGAEPDRPVPPVVVEVPLLVGLSVTAAETRARAAKLTVRTVWDRRGLEAGRVVGQSPRSGRVPQGSIVELVADKGPAMNCVMFRNQLHVFSVENSELVHRWWDGKKWWSESVAGPKSKYVGVRDAQTADAVTAVVEFDQLHCFADATHAWFDPTDGKWFSERLP